MERVKYRGEDKTYEELQKEFDKFCQEQTKEKLPTFYEISSLNGDVNLEKDKNKNNFDIDEFNKKFEEIHFDSKETIQASLPGGYGEFMEKSLNSIKDNKEGVIQYSSLLTEFREENPKNSDFDKEITIYKEPKSIVSNVSNIDIFNPPNNLENYSVPTHMMDYKEAFKKSIYKDYIEKDENYIQMEYDFKNKNSNTQPTENDL